MYAVGGASLASGGITGFIPDQFEAAVRADARINAVVMDGGGNDVLICDAFRFPGCGECKNSTNSPNLPVCRAIIQTALDRARVVMNRAADVGVKDVIYFFYPRVPEGTIIGGAKPNSILDYALPLARDLCNSAAQTTGGRLRCHFVDMIPVFQGHPEYFAPADIHPNGLGSAAMAKAIWAQMRSSCVAQKSASGCCG
jgi:hypothetical protein